MMLTKDRTRLARGASCLAHHGSICVSDGLSGINDKSVHEIVWYARNFEIPNDWQQSDVLLNFARSITPQRFGLTDSKSVITRAGMSLSIRHRAVPEAGRESRHPAGRRSTRPESAAGQAIAHGLPVGIDYYNTTGIWQTVWLESAPPIRVEEIQIVPRADNNQFYLAVFCSTIRAWQIEVEVFDHGHSVTRAEEFTPVATGQFVLRIPYAKLWYPHSPHLYDLRIRLYDDKNTLLDEVTSYFGMRGIELRNGSIRINGEPIYLKMVLDQGYFPGGYLTAASDEALQTDIGWTKMFGFNGARKHQKVEDPRWLYWCDRLGLLVWEEMPNAREWSLDSEELLPPSGSALCVATESSLHHSLGTRKREYGFPGTQQEHAA